MRPSALAVRVLKKGEPLGMPALAAARARLDSSRWLVMPGADCKEGHTHTHTHSHTCTNRAEGQVHMSGWTAPGGW